MSENIPPGKKCSFCENEAVKPNPFAAQLTCQIHKHLQFYYLPEIRQYQYKEIAELPDKYNNCHYCKVQLSDYEKYSTNPLDSHVTCFRHRIYGPVLDENIVRLMLQYEFSERKVNFNYLNPLEMEEFKVWRKKHRL